MVRSLTSWLNGLFRLHNREAVRFAARLVGSRDNGEEIVQNAAKAVRPNRYHTH